MLRLPAHPTRPSTCRSSVSITSFLILETDFHSASLISKYCANDQPTIKPAEYTSLASALYSVEMSGKETPNTHPQTPPSTPQLHKMLSSLSTATVITIEVLLVRIGILRTCRMQFKQRSRARWLRFDRQGWRFWGHRQARAMRRLGPRQRWLMGPWARLRMFCGDVNGYAAWEVRRNSIRKQW